MCSSVLTAAAASYLCLSSLLRQQRRDPAKEFQEQVRVDRVVVDAYVTDAAGSPVLGLQTSDFELLVDGEFVPIESTEWIPVSSAEFEPQEHETSAEVGKTHTDNTSPGRLLIFLFQTDLAETSRALGSMRMALQADRIVDKLLPSDRVAVLSFSAHLTLQQDFTSDRHKLIGAIARAVRTGFPSVRDSESQPSLAQHLDFGGAERTVTPEKAIALISHAAMPITGAKALIFFGWGLQTIGGTSGPNPRDTSDLAEAMPALAAARITIFTLDITDAEYHTSERLMKRIATITGGTYEKTNVLGGAALDRLLRTTSGRYVIVFRKPERPPGKHGVSLRLSSRRGRVLARSVYTD